MEETKQTGYIYKITNILNNKVYIGQTRIKNPIIRWADHFNSAFISQYDYFLYKAMRRSGIENFCFQIIEKDIPIENLNDREIFYIKQYQSNDSKYGYNLTLGGQMTHCSKYNKSQILKVIQDIKNFPNKTLSTIAQENNMTKETVSDINNGDIWYMSYENYPIRECVVKNFLTEDDVIEIKNMLRRGMSSTKIGQIFNVSTTNITNINYGRIYKEPNETYPIFKATNSRPNLTMREIQEVINYLLTTNYNYNEISEILHIGRKTISNIDKGKGYINEVMSLGYKIFPLRK